MGTTSKICKGCNQEFEGTAKTDYCPNCRKIRYNYTSDKSVGKTENCIDCGAEFIRTSPAQKYCADCSKKHIQQASVKSKTKYNKKAYDRLEMKVPKGNKDAIVAHAEKQGESLNQFLNRAVDNQILADNKKE